MPVKCFHCDSEAVLVTGRELYPHRPDLKRLYFWRCEPCQAHVGCHPDSSEALGRPANAQLRYARHQAHLRFDPMWKNGNLSRSGAYGWLADRLGIPKHKTHIGQFDLYMCQRVVEVITEAETEWSNAQ